MKKKKEKIKNKEKVNVFELVKDKFMAFLGSSKLVFSDNKLIIYFIIGNVINSWLLRTLTIGNWYSLAPLLADLVISIVVGSFALFVKKKYQFTYLMIMTVFSVIINLGNMIYYIYYSSYISVTFISFVLTNANTGDANVVGGLLQFKVFLFLWFIIYMIVGYFLFGKKRSKNKLERKIVLANCYSWALLFLILFLFMLKPVDYSRFYKQWNREYLVSRFGIYLYQMNDIVKSIEPQMASLFGSDKANKEINDYYENNINVEYTNKYSNIFKDKNVIAIHAESIQNAVIGLEINGKLVAPNLTRLSNQGIYFDNFYSQVSFGTSSDTEFTLATSLMPVNSGTVFINYSDKTYMSMYKELKNLDYYIFSMHANTGDFWNRNIMHQNLGYDKFYDKSFYNIDETIGFGLSDKSFIMQSVDEIEKIAKEHDKYYGTLITLSNHTPFDYTELFGEFDVSKTVDGVKYPYLEGTKLGNYFKSVHYADQQLGLLVEELEKRGLMNDSIIVIYGDHDARISTSEWRKFYNYDHVNDSVLDEEDPNYVELDYYWQELNRKVPFIIYSNDKEIQNKYSMKNSNIMGMYDVAPTLSNMLGFDMKYALGNDIFEIGDKNVVVLPNGNFITNYVYYNDNKGEYKLLKDTPLNDEYINECKNYTQEVLKISNQVIVYDYFKKLNSKEEYEVEK